MDVKSLLFIKQKGRNVSFGPGIYAFKFLKLLAAVVFNRRCFL